MNSSVNVQSAQPGATARVFRVVINADTGGSQIGLTNASSGLSITAIASNSSVATVYTGADILGTSTIGTWEDPGAGNIRFKEVDQTAHPGLYEIHVEDSILENFAADHIMFSLFGVTGMEDTQFKVIFDFKVQDTFNFFDGLANASNMALSLAQGAAILTTIQSTGVIVHASAKTGYFLNGTQVFNNTGTWTGSLTGGVDHVVNGVGGTVAGLANGSITASTIANGAFTGVKFGDGFIAGISFDTSADSHLLGLILGGSVNRLIAAIPTAPANSYGALLVALKAVFDEIETGITLKQALRAILAVAAGQVTGADTNNITFKNPDGSATRVAAVTDDDGNRSSVTVAA